MVTKERRSKKRISVAIEVFDSDDDTVLGTIKNLTAVGCFIVFTGELLSIGTIKTIHFNLPQISEEIESKAKVMWQKETPHGIGIIFFFHDRQAFFPITGVC